MWKTCSSWLIEWKVTSLLRQEFVLLLGVTFLTGAFVPSARAECGDYVLRGGKAKSEHTSSGAMDPLKSAQHEHQPPVRRGSPHSPCHGPHCSNGFPSPPVPTSGSRSWRDLGGAAFADPRHFSPAVNTPSADRGPSGRGK
jgi:hypothetical protein